MAGWIEIEHRPTWVMGAGPFTLAVEQSRSGYFLWVIRCEAVEIASSGNDTLAAAKSAALAEARRLLREAMEEIGDG